MGLMIVSFAANRYNLKGMYYNETLYLQAVLVGINGMIITITLFVFLGVFFFKLNETRLYFFPWNISVNNFNFFKLVFL